jgi:23S rRNA (guanosine2251-2'-O)-methyltransferase
VIIYGINPIHEALRAGRVVTLHVADRANPRVRSLVDLARKHGVPVKPIDGPSLERETRGGVHQGVMAEARADRVDYTVEDLVASTDGPALILILDAIEDPQNVGAIIRTADAAGVHGVVRQTRRAGALDGAAAKASAGALAFVKIATVVNIARAIEELKALGVWSVGLDAEASDPLDTVDLTVPTAIVLGAEGSGLRRLVRERCDRLATIPMRGHVGSLNVSVAAGIAAFEALRQRRSAPVRK